VVVGLPYVATSCQVACVGTALPDDEGTKVVLKTLLTIVFVHHSVMRSV